VGRGARGARGLLMAQTSGTLPALYDRVKKTTKPCKGGKKR